MKPWRAAVRCSEFFREHLQKSTLASGPRCSKSGILPDAYMIGIFLAALAIIGLGSIVVRLILKKPWKEIITGWLDAFFDF